MPRWTAQPIERGAAIDIAAGQTLALGRATGGGMRGYILFAGGLDIPPYLGSRSTFALGQFGGHARAAAAGGRYAASRQGSGGRTCSPAAPAPELRRDTGRCACSTARTAPPTSSPKTISPPSSAPIGKCTTIRNRTGVRLVGPKPEWARKDGGEAGLPPSNIHDNPYAIGAVDFTGDMPIILGPDGPSLGGFVRPFTVIAADRWKIGQLVARTTACVSCRSPIEDAAAADRGPRASPTYPGPRTARPATLSPILATIPAQEVPAAYRLSPAGRPHHPRRVRPDRARHRIAHPRPRADGRARRTGPARRDRHRAGHSLAPAPFRRRGAGPARRARGADGGRGARSAVSRPSPPLAHRPPAARAWRDPATIEERHAVGLVRRDVQRVQRRRGHQHQRHGAPLVLRRVPAPRLARRALGGPHRGLRRARA